MRDRLDLWVRAEEPGHGQPDGAESSAAVAARIATARAWQSMRPAGPGARPIDLHRDLRPRARSLLARRGEQFRLSPRRLQRSLLVARTIADLEMSEAIDTGHIDEALHYRPEAGT
jgi:magnesium chelatase family protein